MLPVPIDTTFDEQRRVFVHVASGSVGPGDVLSAVATRPTNAVELPAFWDIRGATLEISKQDLSTWPSDAAISRVKKLRRGSKTAVVTSNSEQTRFVSEDFAPKLSTVEMRAFQDDPDAALDWLTAP